MMVPEWEMNTAKAAYEGYCGYTDGKSLATGDSLPKWEDLNPTICNAWHAAIKAALKVARRVG